jgi:hypothetical protein
METESIPNTDSVREHTSIAFIILFDGDDPNGLEVTKESIASQAGIESKIFECLPEQITELKSSIDDDQFVIILRSGDIFYSESSAKELASNITDKIECIYSDSIIISEGDQLPQLLFPFSLEGMSSGYMITNIALSAKLFKRLTINPKLNFLLGHDIINKAVKTTKVRHVAEFKFLLPSRSVNIEDELKVLV